MSTRDIITVAGFAVGAYFGNPGLGLFIGSAIGNAVDPLEVTGPRLQDLKTTGLEYGSVIPVSFGHPRLPGIVAWSSDKREVESTESGKGGPEQTTYSYRQDLLFLLSANPQDYVRRVWANGKLIWTAADDATDGSLQASANAPAWEAFEVFPGTDDQMPWSVYEAAVGVGNAPAYRGRLSVGITGLDLGGSGYMPQLTFEVVRVGTLAGPVAPAMHAPQDSSLLDIIDPPASVQADGNVTASPTGTIIDADVNAVHRLTYQTVAGGKLDITAPVYSGQRVVMRWTIAFDVTLTDPTSGFIPTLQLRYGRGPFDDAVAFFVQVNPETGEGLDVITAASNETIGEWGHHGPPGGRGEFSMVWDPDGTSVHMYSDDTLLRTITIPRFYAFLITDVTSWYNGPRRIRLTDLIVYGGRDISTVTSEPDDLADVVLDLCTSAGLDASYVDVSALAGQPVHALAVTQVTPARQVIEMLMAAYHFTAVESDQLRFVLRGGAPVATIPYADMGASEGDPPESRLPISRASDVEIPAQVSITYSNVDADYQSATEYSDRLSAAATGVQAMQIPLGLEPQQAKRIADVQLLDATLAAVSLGPVAVPMSYAALEPADVVLLVDRDGNTFRARVERISDAGYIRSLTLVLDDASILSSAALTDESYTSSTIVRQIVDTLLRLLDIPILRDTDNDPGYYAAFAPTSADGRWPGAKLLRGQGDTGYTEVAEATDRTVIGTTLSVLPAWSGGWVWDEVSSVDVEVVGDLEHYSRDSILAGSAPAYLIGDEIVFARRATEVSAGVYTLSGLLRGRRGTEWATGTHAVGERVVRLQMRGLRRVALEAGQLGVSLSHRAPTLGRSLASAGLVEFADTGVGLKPFAPVHLRVLRRPEARQVVVRWSRRTRLSARLVGASGISVPLGEAAEAYAVEVINGDGDVAETYTVTEPSITLTEPPALSLVADGGVVAPAWGLVSMSAELVGVRDDQGGTYTTPKYLSRFDAATGAQIAQTPMLGNEIYQWAQIGDDLYACAATFSGGGPFFYAGSKLWRFGRTSLAAPTSTYTSGTPGELAGLATDGSDIWVSEQYTGLLRRLSASLVSSATYSVEPGIGALAYSSGVLWIVSRDTAEVIKWDIATTAELLRVATPGYPFDVLVAGGLVFVLSGAGVTVIDAATGAVVATHELSPFYLLPGRGMCLFGSRVAVCTAGGAVVLLDAATGALVGSVAAPDARVLAAIGSHLYVTRVTTGSSAQTTAYLLDEETLPAYEDGSVRVYQVSATVGRGYPAEVSLLPPGAHRHWRILITANNGDAYTSMQEIELRGTVGGADLTEPGMSCTASSTYSGDGITPGKAIDGDLVNYLNNCWISGGGAAPHYWQLDAGRPIVPVELAIWCQAYAGGPARAPLDFSLLYADSAAGPWTEAGAWTGQTGWVVGTPKTFTF